MRVPQHANVLHKYTIGESLVSKCPNIREKLISLKKCYLVGICSYCSCRCCLNLRVFCFEIMMCRWNAIDEYHLAMQTQKQENNSKQTGYSHLFISDLYSVLVLRCVVICCCRRGLWKPVNRQKGRPQIFNYNWTTQYHIY